MPDDEYYEEYAQLDNGVGMLRLLQVEFETALKVVDSTEGDAVPFTVATGVFRYRKTVRKHFKFCIMMNTLTGHCAAGSSPLPG